MDSYWELGLMMVILLIALLGARFLVGCLLLPFLKVVGVSDSRVPAASVCGGACRYLVSGEKRNSRASALQDLSEVLPILQWFVLEDL